MLPELASLSGPIVSVQCSFVTAYSGQIYDDDDDDDTVCTSYAARSATTATAELLVLILAPSFNEHIGPLTSYVLTRSLE